MKNTKKTAVVETFPDPKKVKKRTMKAWGTLGDAHRAYLAARAAWETAPDKVYDKLLRAYNDALARDDAAWDRVFALFGGDRERYMAWRERTMFGPPREPGAVVRLPTRAKALGEDV
jgi:hypothetical protein